MWITADSWQRTEQEILQFVQDFEKDNPVPVKGKHIWFNYLAYSVSEKFFQADKPGHWSRSKCALDIRDPELIYNVWRFFRMLSMKFGVTPTVQRFGRFINLNSNTIYDWKYGRTRKLANSNLIKRILWECECDLWQKAIDDGSVGAMFVLKSRYGYKDKGNDFTINVSAEDFPKFTQEEIKEKLEKIESAESRGRGKQ